MISKFIKYLHTKWYKSREKWVDEQIEKVTAKQRRDERIAIQEQNDIRSITQFITSSIPSRPMSNIGTRDRDMIIGLGASGLGVYSPPNNTVRMIAQHDAKPGELVTVKFSGHWSPSFDEGANFDVEPTFEEVVSDEPLEKMIDDILEGSESLLEASKLKRG